MNTVRIGVEKGIGRGESVRIGNPVVKGVSGFSVGLEVQSIIKTRVLSIVVISCVAAVSIIRSISGQSVAIR